MSETPRHGTECAQILGGFHAERGDMCSCGLDALLAVAKVADGYDHVYLKDRLQAIADAIDALDAAHPNWREWTP